MSRRITCVKCSYGPMHPEDVANGFERRIVTGKARKPAVHQIKTYTDGKLTETETLATLVCDDCGAPIPDGNKCIAVSVWRGCELDAWESEFMEV